jgi:hypothetical protein
MFAFVARAAETTNSSGVLTLAEKYCWSKNSGVVTMRRVTSRRSPFVSRNFFVARSTSAAGG